MNQLIEDFIKNIYSAVEHEPDKYELRVSSLPWCTMLKLIEYLKSPTKRIDYSFRHYVRVGTAMHSNIQHSATISSLKSNVLAKWPLSCDERNMSPNDYKKHIASLPILPTPKKLKLCKKYPGCGCHNQGIQQMEEVDFYWKGVSGHLDMLSSHQYGGKQVYVAWEFKSTSDSSVATGKYLPQAKHTVQIETYCLLLKLLYDIKVDSYVIVYFGRDTPGKDETDSWLAKRKTPTHRSFLVKVTNRMLNKHFDQCKRLIAAYTASKSILAKVQEGKRKLSDFKYEFLTIAENRPCKSAKEYASYTKLGFFGNSSCPYAQDDCSCFDETNNVKPIKEIMRVVANLEKE